MSESPAENRRIDVAQAFLDRLEAFDLDGFVSLWAEAGEQFNPYAPDGFPDHLDGRDAIAENYGGLADQFDSMEYTEREIALTGDGKVVSRFKGGIAKKDGGRYDNNYITVMEFDENDKIRRYWEYFDPAIVRRDLMEDA